MWKRVMNLLLGLMPVDPSTQCATSLSYVLICYISHTPCCAVTTTLLNSYLDSCRSLYIFWLIKIGRTNEAFQMSRRSLGRA